MRVFELARELNTKSKELLTRLQSEGVEVGNVLNALPEEVVQRLRDQARAPGQPSAAAPKPATKPAPAAIPEPAPKPEKKTEPKPTPQSAPEPETEPEPVAVPQPDEDQPPDKTIKVQGAIIVRDFATKMNLKPNQLIADLMGMNVFASINEKLDIKTAQQIAEKHGFILEHERKAPEIKAARIMEDEVEQEDAPEDLQPRAPIVTFMGHIDHGKTSLLDYIRKTSVAKNEAGGITQHIGAYTIRHAGQPITFLDTPGHAAFTAMRARGANLTDIAVIVVAADDGIMPQTEEAIKHAQAAETSIIIAINKIDLPGANPDQVKRQLQTRDLSPEDWGGTTICCEVSAQTGAGMDHLLEMILLQAEIMELKANPKARAEGFVIEAQMETGMGPTAHLMVTRGTLHVGDTIVCGSYWGKIKALINDHGAKTTSAPPSTPVKCMGLSGIPPAGELFREHSNDRSARQLAEQRTTELRNTQLATPATKTSLENLFERMEQNKRLELKVILKCDTQGSLEAIRQLLEGIRSEKVSINMILSGIGVVTENDVLLASASDAIIIGFNVGKPEAVTRAAKCEGVEIRLYSIIYNIADDIREAMVGMLDPEIREKVMGQAEVRQVFPISKTGNIAGCLAINGRLHARYRVRVKRKGELMYAGSVITLKRFQDEVNEVREGQECGIRLDNFSDFAPGDILEFFEIEKIPSKL